MISIYSVVSSIVFYSLSLIILFVLRRKTDFMARYAISTLLLLSVLSVIRLLVPLDFKAAYIIRSDVILPKIIDLLNLKFNIWPISIGNTLLLIWGIGTIFYIVKFILTEVKAYKARKRYPCFETEQLRRVTSTLDKAYVIKLSPKVSQPYTVGIVKPVIYLPVIQYTDSELYYILLHETQHIKSHHNLNRLFFIIIEAIFWWNPLAHIAVNEFELLTECQCDSSVTASMDRETLVAYLRAIISVVKRLNPDEDKAKPKLAVMFAPTYDMKQRFEVLLRRNDRKPKYIRYTVCIIMLVLFVLSYFVIVQPYYPPPDTDGYQAYDILISPENSYIEIDNGKYYFVYEGTKVHLLTEDELLYPPYNILKIIGG